MTRKYQTLTPLHHAYPENLKLLDHPPASLYVLGRFQPADQLAIAVIGSRQMSAYGKKVTEEIGGLPSVKFHCGVLAVGALKRAIRKYFDDRKITEPAWMPKENTFEEKQALEEEELAKTLSKRVKPEEPKSP